MDVAERSVVASMSWDRKKLVLSAVLFAFAITCIYSTVTVAGSRHSPWSLWLAALGLGCAYVSAQLLTQAIETPQRVPRVQKKTE